MYHSSDEAMADKGLISVERARAELARHGCRILAVEGVFLHVTNDCDPDERIRCTPKAILDWLGY